MTSQLIDAHSRIIRNIRISVTDRCNLRCNYCFTEEPVFLPKKEFLTYEELHTIIGILTDYGINKIRITGGEPLVRKDIIPFMKSIKTTHPNIDLRITTNAVLLENALEDLQKMDVKHLNISLDTFSREKFKEITGFDNYDKVYSSILKAISMGFAIKINAVAMKGFNDTELKDFLNFAIQHPVSVRFIEYMPISSGSTLSKNYFWSAQDILKEAQGYVHVNKEPVHNEIEGPARVYSISGAKGSLGFISPVSEHFCNTCDRLRLTATGAIRTCLYSTKEHPLRNILRNPSLGIPIVKQVLEQAVSRKPFGYELLANLQDNGFLSGRSMNAIGG
ncbi:MAG: GTP 3',8-cyclase MoaA [Desulfovibrionaceae bacterium]